MATVGHIHLCIGLPCPAPPQGPECHPDSVQAVQVGVFVWENTTAGGTDSKGLEG